MSRPTVNRLDEIATKAIHKLLEIDELTAKEFFVDELDITEEEINYFEIDWYHHDEDEPEEYDYDFEYCY